MNTAATPTDRTKSQAVLNAEISSLVYPAFPASLKSGWFATASAEHMDPKGGSSSLLTETVQDASAQFEERLAEESRRSFESGRECGRQEGIQVEREVQGAMRSSEENRRVEQIAALILKFDEERDRYLHAVEHEVVELALEIAARVLRREVQMDPLLLTGAVRVALGQLANTTKVLLRVPAADFDMWTEAIEHLPNLAAKPKVLADDGMRLGDCVIETQLGSVDLGIRSQLKEIERGFFDRADRNRKDRDVEVPAKTSDRKTQL